MSIFRRCKHTWEIKAVQNYDRMERFAWEKTWDNLGSETIIRYVCSKCHDDRKRTVIGTFSVALAKEVFPKP